MQNVVSYQDLDYFHLLYIIQQLSQAYLVLLVQQNIANTILNKYINVSKQTSVKLLIVTYPLSKPLHAIHLAPGATPVIFSFPLPTIVPIVCVPCPTRQLVIQLYTNHDHHMEISMQIDIHHHFLLLHHPTNTESTQQQEVIPSCNHVLVLCCLPNILCIFCRDQGVYN